MLNEHICFSSAVELVDRIRNKELSPVEVADAFLGRIESVNPTLMAYVTVTADLAREAARRAEAAVMAGARLGSLHGIPFSVKDLLYTRGVRTTAGSLVYRDFVPDEDSMVVARLKAAGAILLGKTNTPEFGYKATTENLVFGETRNPWALDKTPGGSSGGAGAATAAGLAPLSVGTDGGGSIRIPASFSGVFGFKPSFGRVPSGPGFAGWSSLAHIGPMTRCVADAALMMDVIAGPDERDRNSLPAESPPFSLTVNRQPRHLRIGWSRDLGYAAVDPQVVTVVERAVEAFGELGWQVDQIGAVFDDPSDTFNCIIRAENYLLAGELLSNHAELLDPGMRAFARRGAGISALDYLRTTRERGMLAARLAEYFERFDLLVTPTLAVPPFVIDTRPTTIGGRAVSPMGWNPFTYPFNLTGNPAASLPCGWTVDGLPIGLQIVGPRFADALVLRASAAFEKARPWRDRHPPTRTCGSSVQA